MLVKINEYFSGDMICCSNTLGKLTVRWIGSKPILNSEYDVELDIEKTLVWGKDIILSKTVKHFIMTEKALTVLNGVLESVDADGYAILRVGNSIVPFMSEGTAFEIGSIIKIKVNYITVSPITY